MLNEYEWQNPEEESAYREVEEDGWLTLWVAALAGFHHGSLMHAVITTALSSLCVAATPQVPDTAFLIVIEKSWCDWIAQDSESSKT